MGKGITLAGMAFAFLVFILCAADLLTNFPFRGASKLLDIVFLICAVLLAYLSWSTYREMD